MLGPDWTSAPLTIFGSASFMDIVKDVLTTATLLATAIVGYRKFVLGASLGARANITQSVQSARLNSRHTVVQVTITAENTGDTTLEPVEGYTILQLIRPLSDTLETRIDRNEDPIGVTGTEIDFPKLGPRRDYRWEGQGFRIDPKENTTIYAEFIIPSRAEVLNVFSELTLDHNHPDVGWEINTYHTVTDKVPGGDNAQAAMLPNDEAIAALAVEITRQVQYSEQSG